MIRPIESLREIAEHAELMAKDGWHVGLLLGSKGITVEIEHGIKAAARDVTWDEIEDRGAAAAIRVIDRIMLGMGYQAP